MTDVILPRIAIDTALIKGNLGCQYLEINRPTKQDLKTAAEAFKDASDILKASQVLLDHDCYLVQDPPEPADTPLFTAKGEPTKAADVTQAPEPAATVAGTLGCIDVEIVAEEGGRRFKVGDKVKDVNDGELGTVVEDNGEPEDDTPYMVEWAQHGLIGMSADELEIMDENPVDTEEAIEAEPFPTGNKTAQEKVFEERLSTLEDIFCERLDLKGNTDPYGKQLNLFRPYRDAWASAWKADAPATWSKVLKAIADANTVATEFDAWAPVA